MLTIRPDLITRVPVEQRGNRCYVGGVGFFFDRPCRISERLYVQIDMALNAKAAASGSNMPVALDLDVWLLRCRRCQAPFIALPSTKLCSDRCRAESKRDAATRSKAERIERGWRELGGEGRFVCNQCGRLRSAASRRTKRFCSVRCRVAAHRGVPAKPSDAEALDYQIAGARDALGAMKMCGGGATEMRGLMEHIVALQAERAKLAPLRRP